MIKFIQYIIFFFFIFKIKIIVLNAKVIKQCFYIRIFVTMIHFSIFLFVWRIFTVIRIPILIQSEMRFKHIIECFYIIYFINQAYEWLTGD